MKKTFILITISTLCFACNPNKDKQVNIETGVSKGKTAGSDSLKEFEDALDDIAVGGKGVMFENGAMSFDIESLESSAKKAEQQLNHIKAKNDYESEALKKKAIMSMELNLKLFQGVFCCTTHKGKHCADSKELKTLKSQYGCDRFMGKK